MSDKIFIGGFGQGSYEFINYITKSLDVKISNFNQHVELSDQICKIHSINNNEDEFNKFKVRYFFNSPVIVREKQQIFRNFVRLGHEIHQSNNSHPLLYAADMEADGYIYRDEAIQYKTINYSGDFVINPFEIHETLKGSDEDLDHCSINSVTNRTDSWRKFVPSGRNPLKLAICVSGQPRFVKGKHNISLKRTITDFYDCDFFCHYWWDDSGTKTFESSPWSGLGDIDVNETTPNNIIELYNPVKISSDPIMTVT